jgi:hypothetical protein
MAADNKMQFSAEHKDWRGTAAGAGLHAVVVIFPSLGMGPV